MLQSGNRVATLCIGTMLARLVLKLHEWPLISAQLQVSYCSLRFQSTVLIELVASSVDAERAFSVGRRQVNFMQHSMSSQTFKAKMGLGSWKKLPFFPSISELAEKLLT